MVSCRRVVRITALCVGVGAILTCEGSTSTAVDELGPVATVEVSPEAYTLERGETLRLTAVLKDANGNVLHRRVTWGNLDPFAVEAECNTGSFQFPNICDVSAVGWGTAVITATADGKRGLSTIEVPDPRPQICGAQSQIPEAECMALGSFFEATGGPEWRRSDGWWSEMGPCSWHGVYCRGGSVTALHLNGNHLSGALTPELEGLSNLEVLYLSINQLSGSIPPELGNLLNLEWLDLGGNDLTGSIPAELGNLSNLEALDLDYNQLTGPIPPELGNLSILWKAKLLHNELSGPIPAEIGNMSSLGSLYLDYNKITGPLPPELGNLSELRWLSAQSNSLSGPLPAELGNLSKLERLDLRANQLAGVIPAEFGNLSSLQWLDLGWNELRGLVPLGVAQLLGQIPTCTARPKNDGLIIPDTATYRSADLDGDGLICGVGFWPNPTPAAPDPVSELTRSK